jgi:hypothetical protein
MLSTAAKRHVARLFDLIDESAICENGEEVHCYVVTPLGVGLKEYFAGFAAELEREAAACSSAISPLADR